ncbi:hypothetical protein FM036_32820 [Nostoc sp. HG1]|nr:hypothetical protein [Nostoc sp. HG1]
MLRFAAAIIVPALALGSAPAFAAAGEFRAVPVVAAKAGPVVVGETLWACGAAACTTTSATARPAIVCAQAVRKLGRLDSFSASGTVFDAAALATCNARAKGAPTAIATN